MEKTWWKPESYLSIEDHVDSLVDDILGVLAQELQDVLHLGLVGQAPQPDAVLPRAGSDQLLGYHSHGGQTGGEAGDQRGPTPPSPSSSSSSSDQAGLASPGLSGSVEDLLDLGRGGPEELDVAGADDVFVFGQGLLSLGLLGEQDEGISRGPTVRLLDEQNPVFLVQNVAGLLAAIEELDLRNRKSQ